MSVDTTERGGAIAWMARNHVTANLLMIAFILGGLLMTSRIKQEIFPELELDFIFVTDHATIRQKVECSKHPGVWWGQEPGAGPHHVCVLAANKKFVPRGDMRKDADRLRALGHFFFYPHPVGWYPSFRSACASAA